MWIFQVRKSNPNNYVGRQLYSLVTNSSLINGEESKIIHNEQVLRNNGGRTTWLKPPEPWITRNCSHASERQRVYMERADARAVELGLTNDTTITFTLEELRPFLLLPKEMARGQVMHSFIKWVRISSDECSELLRW